MYFDASRGREALRQRNHRRVEASPAGIRGKLPHVTTGAARSPDAAASGTSGEEGRRVLTVDWLKQSLRDLAAGTIAPAAIFRALEEDPRPLWKWPEFADLRARKLQERCAECGSSDILVMQHMIQPRRAATIRAEVERRVARRHARTTTGEPEDTPSEVYVVTAPAYQGCPSCGTRTFYARTTKSPTYRCANGHTFDALCSFPSRTYEQPVLSPGQVRQLRRLELLAEHRVEIEQQVARSAVQQVIAYFAGHGAVTACKRCAFRFDAARLETRSRL